MTGSEISNIIVTIGVSQLILDLLSNYFVYNGDRYQRALRNLESTKSKLTRAEFDVQSKGNKHLKRMEKCKADYSMAAADVARRHMVPNLFSSMFFFFLLKILGTEHKGKVMGVLPFVPYTILTRITSRGLDWKDVSPDDLVGTKMDPKQAFSFLFVYILAGLTVKYYVNKAVGIKPPKGADGGVQTIVDSPMGQAMARSLGLDPKDLKMD